MSRSARRFASAVGLVAVASIVVGACSASAPALTDPKEIVAAAVRSAESAKSVHIEMTLDGSVTAESTGGGAAGPTIAFKGTTASADVDIAAGNAHASFSMPAFLGLTGDLIQIGGTSYIKTSLTAGGLYQSQKAASALPIAPTGSGSVVGSVSDFLSRPGVDPVKGDDVACGSTQCYTVKIELTPAELVAMGADAAAASGLPVDLASASVNVTIRVEKDTNHLAGVAATVGLGEQGSITFDMAMSKWDQPVTITAPPADQIQAGS
jgi:hypothetical protein